MKTRFFLALGVMTAALGFYACQKSADSKINVEEKLSAKPLITSSGECSNYDVVLAPLDHSNGQTTFLWTITNLKPGNGKNGTSQNLSHWDFVAEACENTDNNIVNNWDHILEVYYRYGTSGDWVPVYTIDPNDIYPSPALPGPDASISGCSSANMFKFNQGTNGSTPTQYKIVLAGNWSSASTTAWFKSGTNTGCCTKTVQGIGCLEEISCSLSQGYWFAKLGDTWMDQSVTLGGETYTEEEGKSIWNCSNAGGIKDSKKAFISAAAIKLSMQVLGEIIPQSVLDDVAIIDNYLSSLNKLTTYNCNLPTGGVSGTAAAAAAGRISDWINANHCGEEQELNF